MGSIFYEGIEVHPFTINTEAGGPGWQLNDIFHYKKFRRNIR